MGLPLSGSAFVNRSLKSGHPLAEVRSVSLSVPVPAHPGRQEVAVVRHPIADARNIVVGYELRFGGAVDLGDPAMDAKATSALLVEAFGDIGLETLAGRHPAWVTIARNFLVEIGPPPVRPDRAVLQIKAYSARDDLLDDPAEARPLRLHPRAGRIRRRRWSTTSRSSWRSARSCASTSPSSSGRGSARASCASPRCRARCWSRPRSATTPPSSAARRSASPTSRASTSPSRAPSSTTASPPPASARCAASPS